MERYKVDTMLVGFSPLCEMTLTDVVVDKTFSYLRTYLSQDLVRHRRRRHHHHDLFLITGGIRTRNETGVGDTE